MARWENNMLPQKPKGEIADESKVLHKVLVIGYSQGGKSTVAGIVADILNEKHISASTIIIGDYSERYGISIETIRAHKEQYRSSLFWYGRYQQEIDHAYPASKAIKCGYHVVDGVRNKDELAAVRELFDLVIWVDRPGYAGNATDNLEPDDADVIIVNDGSVDDLRSKVSKTLDDCLRMSHMLRIKSGQTMSKSPELSQASELPSIVRVIYICQNNKWVVHSVYPNDQEYSEKIPLNLRSSVRDLVYVASYALTPFSRDHFKSLMGVPKCVPKCESSTWMRNLRSKLSLRSFVRNWCKD